MNKDEEMYEITPKGLFAMALLETHLVEHIDDWRIDAAYRIFELSMKNQGFIVDEDDGK